MSLILCRKEQVKHPYYIECLGIHIYSSQELCYVIFHHPLLVLDGFIDSHLLDFMREELDMGFTALKAERWLKSGENPDEALVLILQESEYYTTAEINKFRQKLGTLRKLSPAEYAKRKADYLFQYKQYGKAIASYESLLEDGKTAKLDDGFRGRVWNNLGCAYARVFLFDKAFEALDKAYGLLKSKDVLEKLYDITLLKPELALKERYQSIAAEELKEEWERNFKEAGERAAEAPELKALEELFQKDSIKRMEGASKMVQEWKKEYRAMG